jgi:hypothetical protein
LEIEVISFLKAFAQYAPTVGWVSVSVFGIGFFENGITHITRSACMNLKKVLLAGSVLTSCLISAAAFAIPGPAPDPCRVTRVTAGTTVYYVPSGGSGRYNLLAWGNGTGASSNTYPGLLEAAAARCVLVAAATTSSSGDGTAVQASVNAAKIRFASILRLPLKVCTSGHSQGGGGAFNAANLLAANCVIAVQPDTVYTTRISRPVSITTDVVCIFSTGDTLAPASPSNSANCRRNSPIGHYFEEIVAGSHFTPTQGTGGAVGAMMRTYIDRWMVN